MDESKPAGEHDPARMRASDSDRDRVAEQLREALAEGRLSAEEHAERLDAVYQAKTYAELAPIVHDLPTTGGTTPPQVNLADPGVPAPPAGSPNIVAIFSGAERKGRWLVPADSNVVAVFGGVELDLRQAILSQREVTINVVCIMGGVNLIVPPGVRVANSVAAILGGTSVEGGEGGDADAPLIRLTGMTFCGGVSVVRREPGEIGRAAGRMDHRELHHEQRRIHREFREKQRAIHQEFRDRQRRLRRRHRD